MFREGHSLIRGILIQITINSMTFEIKVRRKFLRERADQSGKTRLLTWLALFPSAVLYACQIFLFTTDQELINYGIFGLLWFVMLLAWPSSHRLIFAGLSAVVIGFAPHRLRFGSGLDLFVVLFPLVHFCSTYIYLFASKPQESG